MEREISVRQIFPTLTQTRANFIERNCPPCLVPSNRHFRNFCTPNAHILAKKNLYRRIKDNILL